VPAALFIAGWQLLGWQATSHLANRRKAVVVRRKDEMVTATGRPLSNLIQT